MLFKIINWLINAFGFFKINWFLFKIRNEWVSWFKIVFISFHFFAFWVVLLWRFLIRTFLKYCTKTVFEEISPWAILIRNGMIVVWVLFCVQLSFGMNIFKKKLSPFLCYSFCLLLCSILLASSPSSVWCFFGISMGFPSQFHEISMVFLWDFKKVSMEFQWASMDFKGASMGFPLDSFGISLGILWDFHNISIGFLWHFYEISARFLWGLKKDFYGISMVFPWGFCGISIGFAWGFYGIPMGSLWYSWEMYLGFLKDFHDISLGFLRHFYETSAGFLWDSKRYFYAISMGFVWDFYWIRIVVLWNFYISQGCLWNSYGISMGFGGNSWISMIFLLDSYDISLRLRWDLNKFSMGFPWDSYGTSMAQWPIRVLCAGVSCSPYHSCQFWVCKPGLIHMMV